MVLYVGDDWAEDHHDVQLMDESGERLAARRLPEGVAGVTALHELVAQHAAGPGEVVIGIETDRGPWVSALVAAGYHVYAINPPWPARRAPPRRRSPTPATRRSSPTWYAPTATTTARSPATATRPAQCASSPAPTSSSSGTASASGNATLIWRPPLGAVLMSTVSDFVRLTVQRKCPFGWSLMVDDAAPWHPGGPPARTYLLMVLREMPSSRAVARIESPCRRAC